MDMTTSSCAWNLLLPGNSALEVVRVSLGVAACRALRWPHVWQEQDAAMHAHL